MSKIIVWLFLSLVVIEFARNAVNKSPATGLPCLSITPILSPSPSKAIPISASTSNIFCERIFKVDSSVGSG